MAPERFDDREAVVALPAAHATFLEAYSRERGVVAFVVGLCQCGLKDCLVDGRIESSGAAYNDRGAGPHGGGGPALLILARLRGLNAVVSKVGVQDPRTVGSQVHGGPSGRVIPSSGSAEVGTRDAATTGPSADA